MQVSGKVTSKYFGLMEKSSNNSRVALITKQAGMVLDNGMCQILFFAFSCSLSPQNGSRLCRYFWLVILAGVVVDLCSREKWDFLATAAHWRNKNSPFGYKSSRRVPKSTTQQLTVGQFVV